ncbi:MAG: lantibiotic dehydratase, partial [Rhabdochlamydiaceae bacterium]
IGPYNRRHTEHTFTNTQNKFIQEWEKWLSCLWQTSLCNKQKEISIDEKIIDTILGITGEKLPSYDDALLSLDVFCRIFAHSQDELTKGQFFIQYMAATWEGCNTIGRFLDLLDIQQKEKIQEFIRAEERLESNSTSIEVSYAPQASRNANIAIHPCLRKYCLDTEPQGLSTSYLSLEDIYVGSTFDRFYLTDRKGSFEINAKSGNLLDLNLAPMPIQFIRDVTINKYKQLQPFSWGELEKTAVFLPRLSLHNIIISPARWRLNGSLFKNHSNEKMQAEFRAWANQWELPEQVFIVDNDDQHLYHLSKITFNI